MKLEAKNRFGGRNSGKKGSGDVIDELYSIFSFIDSITLSVEVRDSTRNLLVYFPKKPACFMLSEEAKKDYRADCNISDANTKMLDLMRNFTQFDIQMEGNIQYYSQYPFLYWLFSNDNFKVYTFVIWWLSLLLNVFVAFTVSRGGESLEPTAPLYNTVLIVACSCHSLISFFCLAAWFIFRYVQVVQIATEDYKFDNPGKDASSLRSLFEVLVVKSFLVQPTPLNMLLHCFFSAVGGYLSYFLLSLNLLLVVNISRTTKFILKATFLHFD